MFRTVMIAGIVVVLVISGGFALRHLGIKMQGSYDKALEHNRYGVTKQSQAYRDGRVQDIANMHRDINSDPTNTGLKSSIQLQIQSAQYNDMKTSDLPDYLQTWFTEIRGY